MGDARELFVSVRLGLQSRKTASGLPAQLVKGGTPQFFPAWRGGHKNEDRHHQQ
jgi:hypothetical protein